MASKTIDKPDPEDHAWMRQAIGLARQAEAEGEVPIGAVVVHEGRVVGRGWNRNIGLNDPSAHAEILALREAGRMLGNHRLIGCSLYVTLEPCPMCVGAMIHARLERVVYGSDDPKTGAAGGKFDLLLDPAHNHVPAVSRGCLSEECSELLRSFFRKRRKSGTAAQNTRVQNKENDL
jgi:tRNA(adenine34) deaminase